MGSDSTASAARPKEPQPLFNYLPPALSLRLQTRRLTLSVRRVVSIPQAMYIGEDGNILEEQSRELHALLKIREPDSYSRPICSRSRACTFRVSRQLLSRFSYYIGTHDLQRLIDSDALSLRLTRLTVTVQISSSSPTEAWTNTMLAIPSLLAVCRSSAAPWLPQRSVLRCGYDP